MVIILPDNSIVRFNCRTLQFRSITKDEADDDGGEESLIEIKSKEISDNLRNPKWKFSDCFRRVSDRPRYSPKKVVHDFDILSITTIYRFPGSYQGGAFSSSTIEWRFLDGGIVEHRGYGWGSHDWVAIDGTEALRAICLFYGIKQPRQLMGESKRRPLALLLEEISDAPPQEKRGRLYNMPNPIDPW